MLDIDILRPETLRAPSFQQGRQQATPKRGNFLAPRPEDEVPFHLGIFLVPGFALLSFASAIEPLRGANRLSGRDLYQWTLFSETGGDVVSNGGFPLRTQPLGTACPAGLAMMIVCAGSQGEQYFDAGVAATLRRLRRHDVPIGAISTGSFVLARAGLLRGRRCTVHWDYRESFLENFADHDVSDDIFVIDDGIITCAGETSALDLMLQVVSAHHGTDLARSIAADFLYATVRASTCDQREMRHRGKAKNPLIRRAIDIMEQTLEDPVPPRDIAHKIGISQRQLERLSRRHLGCTPARYHMQLRLDRARRMLHQTNLSVAEVAVASGFVALSHFAKVYKQAFGCSPSKDRLPR